MGKCCYCYENILLSALLFALIPHCLAFFIVLGIVFSSINQVSFNILHSFEFMTFIELKSPENSHWFNLYTKFIQHSKHRVRARSQFLIRQSPWGRKSNPQKQYRYEYNSKELGPSSKATRKQAGRVGFSTFSLLS